ncbi:MAG TPA: hypothetical protein VF283_12135 [Bryobacteraceae bacterium]
MRREPEFFGGIDLDLVYMAKRLRDALKIEQLFTEAELDYVVETGTYNSGVLIRRDLTGAFFYVSPNDLGRARELLVANRYKPYAPE